MYMLTLSLSEDLQIVLFFEALCENTLFNEGLLLLSLDVVVSNELEASSPMVSLTLLHVLLLNGGLLMHIVAQCVSNESSHI